MALFNPDLLLEQADRLVTPVPPETEPRQEDLRRAISAAYYSVFHFTLTAATDTFVGVASRATEQYQFTYRSIEHGWLNELCLQLRRKSKIQKLPNPQVPDANFFGPIANFATIINQLQEDRYSADYDPLFTTTPDETKIIISTAREAITLLQSASNTQRVTFLTLLLYNLRK